MYACEMWSIQDTSVLLQYVVGHTYIIPGSWRYNGDVLTACKSRHINFTGMTLPSLLIFIVIKYKARGSKVAVAKAILP
jgi:hypothetical protein